MPSVSCNAVITKLILSFMILAVQNLISRVSLSLIARVNSVSEVVSDIKPVWN